MRLSEYYVANNDGNMVSGKNEFDKWTCSGDSLCDIFENDKDIITGILSFGLTQIKQFDIRRPLKPPSVIWHWIPIIWKWYRFIPKSNIGCWLIIDPWNTRENSSYTNLEIFIPQICKPMSVYDDRRMHDYENI